MRYRTILCAIAVAASLHGAAADGVGVDYEASIFANASSSDHAPYMIGSWNSGRINGANGIWQDGFITKGMTLDRRFNWGAGFEYIAGYGSAAAYDRYTGDAWITKDVRQASVRIIQLFAEVKYRGVYLLAGMKERGSQIVDNALSSGDLTRSNNARPIPGVAAGFVDFQNIPFTNGWLQIEGEIMYGRFFDRKYRENTFNYYSGVLSDDNWYTYKRCYFRTKPTMPLVVTFGMQTAGEFAGKAVQYRRGKITKEEYRGFHFKDIFEMFFPREGSGEGYYKGNSLGSWDFKAQYAFHNGSSLAAYFEWPWEDGSGIGKQNGWDGLWGLQYDFAKKGAVSKIVVEYFDFTNQSGPIHHAPSDSPGTTVSSGVTGGDNYYNNDFYGPYANYGMSIGSPFVVSPLYNLNGAPGYQHNRARGFHAAAEGYILPSLSYVAKVSWQHAGGTGRQPAVKRLHDTSALVGACWKASGKLDGLAVKAQLAFDTGDLRGDNFGALVGVSYSGNLTLGKK